MTEPTPNPLLDFFEKAEHRLIHKWMHYFEIYHRHFAPFRGREMTLLEFGVSHGGSLQMWKHYFGERARIYGVDIDPRCRVAAGEGIQVITADQGDPRMLEELKRRIPPVDILIDDGGHRMDQQICTLEHMFPHVKDGGIYLVEDLHTSYWEEYGGGYRRPSSFIEYSKGLIDHLNAWYLRQDPSPVSLFTKSAFSMHYYDSVLVIEKRPVSPPFARMKGTPSFPLTPAEARILGRG